MSAIGSASPRSETTGFRWGSETVRSAGPTLGSFACLPRSTPFLQYEPRRHRLPELLLDASRWDSRVHLVHGRRRITFAAFQAAVAATAIELRRRGVGPRDRVLLLAANSPEWVVAFWGGLSAGAILAPGNGWWSEEEVRHAVELVEPALVIGDAKRLAKLPAGVPVMEIAELGPLLDGRPTPYWWPPATVSDGPEHDPAVIVFSSGTTGLAKGATLAHRSLIANVHDLLAVSGRLPHQLGDDRPGAVNLLMGPLFHIGGIQTMCLGLVTGSTLVFLEGRFDPKAVLDVIERERVTVWGGVPTMARRVLDDPSLPGRDVSCVRSVSLGGAPVPTELVDRLREAFPNARRGVSTIYGMTETAGTVASGAGALMAEHPGTSGRPHTLVDLRIADPDEAGVGEILVRTPAQMLGYWGDEHNDVIDDDGFVHTGDLGRIDDGLLFVTGRSKDVVIRGGENIAAPRVEAVLLEHPGVRDAAVIGLAHADLGEEVAAAVVLHEGASVDPETLAAFLGRHLAHFEIPTAWWIGGEALPMGDTGKVDKRALRANWPEQVSA